MGERERRRRREKMEGRCCSPVSEGNRKTSTKAAGGAGGGGREKPFRGVRMRKWGKWVAEIREPNKRSRIWLGSYSTAVAAARAYDTAVFYLRGRSGRLNFPDEVLAEEGSAAASGALSAASIRKKAIEVGSRVDALQAGLSSPPPPQPPRQPKNPDLNQEPSPESSDVD